MSVRIVVIDADPEDLPAVLAAVQRKPVPVLEASPVLALPAPKPRLTRQALAGATTDASRQGKAGKHDAAILKAIGFRALTLSEIAGALCRDKRQVPAMLPRLYGVLKRLVRDGHVVKRGREYAIAGS